MLTLDSTVNVDEIISLFEQKGLFLEDSIKLEDLIFLNFISNKKNIKKKEINEIYIYHPNVDGEGITEYSKILKKRLEKRGIKVFEGVAKTGCVQLIEYESSLDIDLNSFERGSYVEIHSNLANVRKDLVYLTHTFPINLPINWFYTPHIGYDIEMPKVEKKYDWCSFGFSMVFKHYEKIIFLKGHKKLVISINKLLPNKYYTAFLKSIGILSKNLDVKIKDYFTEDELINELAECKAFVFFQDSKRQSSGTMRLAAAFNVPVYAKDSYQARDSQVIRFRKISELRSLNRIYDTINIDDGLDYMLATLEYA
ncbi:hypothetical protein IC006_0481 [Sulfuracidifex tepidarius]|uniref:Uncharacterized protein n=1 Tax=Sulfuracidifex tepidarius TaxID=1294262 RepID=A0A510DST2_9CREN|nr:hypothetical protein [Sulfuracidifex tepidarius]BBG23197.1 hypothetical protein IC006_0481 [Sulfuracidifex tepidarius]